VSRRRAAERWVGCPIRAACREHVPGTPPPGPDDPRDAKRPATWQPEPPDDQEPHPRWPREHEPQPDSRARPGRRSSRNRPGTRRPARTRCHDRNEGRPRARDRRPAPRQRTVDRFRRGEPRPATEPLRGPPRSCRASCPSSRRPRAACPAELRPSPTCRRRSSSRLARRRRRHRDRCDRRVTFYRRGGGPTAPHSARSDTAGTWSALRWHCRHDSRHGGHDGLYRGHDGRHQGHSGRHCRWHRRHGHRRLVRTSRRKHIRYEETGHGQADKYDHRPAPRHSSPVSNNACTQQELLAPPTSLGNRRVGPGRISGGAALPAPLLLTFVWGPAAGRGVVAIALAALRPGLARPSPVLNNQGAGVPVAVWSLFLPKPGLPVNRPGKTPGHPLTRSLYHPGGGETDSPPMRLTQPSGPGGPVTAQGQVTAGAATCSQERGRRQPPARPESREDDPARRETSWRGHVTTPATVAQPNCNI
jgi:hypothetical protein